MKVVVILPDSQLLIAVKSLWRRNSETLGMMNDGGFDDHAERGKILGLVDKESLAGYLMYRVSHKRAKIVHLCIDESHRGKGASKKLIDELVKVTNHLVGIELRCRRDFPVSALWPKLGFVPIGERRGRAKAGSTLTVWAMDYGKPNLLTASATSRVLDAVIDANVLIDIVDQRDEESTGLCADWLQDELRLCITDEVFVDFNRQADDIQRAKRFVDAEEFQRLTSTPGEYTKVEQLLKPILPQPKTPRDESDVRHLIRAVAAGAKVFVSRDGPMLGHAEAVYDATGLSIVRPSQLIARLDELAREGEFQRTMVAGTRQVIQQRVSSVEESVVLLIQQPSESKRDIERQLRHWLANPHRFSCEKLSDADGTLLAFYVIETDAPIRRLPFFRVPAKQLSGTISRAVLTTQLRSIVDQRLMGLVICDPLLTAVQVAACQDLGFQNGARGWTKLTISGVYDRIELQMKLGERGFDESIVASLSDSLTNPASEMLDAELEHVLWPAKLRSSTQGNFIIPIRPDFAQELFEERLARQTLYGADINLALNSESVYYRSAKPRVVHWPGRILWYVSDKGKLDGIKSIRACSRIMEVVVDKPKPVYRRFQRLGVYEWSDVFKKAGRDLENPVMAIRFDDTELLNPVDWDIFQSVLRSNGIHTNLEGPVEITAKAFEELYALAIDPS